MSAGVLLFCLSENEVLSVQYIWRQTDRARALPAAREPAARELTAIELVTRVRNTEAIESIIATHAIKYLIPFLDR